MHFLQLMPFTIFQFFVPPGTHYCKRMSGQTTDSSHFTPGIMFTVKQLHLIPGHSAYKVPLSNDKKEYGDYQSAKSISDFLLTVATYVRWLATRSLGVAYCWVDKGSMEWEVRPDTSTHDQQWELNPRPSDLSPTPYPLGHMLSLPVLESSCNNFTDEQAGKAAAGYLFHVFF